VSNYPLDDLDNVLTPEGLGDDDAAIGALFVRRALVA
jgi:hypothetical protein